MSGNSENKTFSKKNPTDNEGPFDDECPTRPRRRRREKEVYIYGIHHLSSLSTTAFLEATQDEVKINRAIKVSPTAWKLFKYWVARTNPDSSMSDQINEFVIQYVLAAMENRHQPKITQYFINKPNVVNISEKQTVKVADQEPLPDFSKMSDEELQERYDRAVRTHNHARAQTLQYHIKKRRGLTAR